MITVRRSFYPFCYAFEVKQLKKSVYEQLISTMTTRDFFSRSYVVATAAIKHFEQQGAITELGKYTLLIKGRKDYELFKDDNA